MVIWLKKKKPLLWKVPHTHKPKWLSGSFLGHVVLKLCLISSFYQPSKNTPSITVLQNPLIGFTKSCVQGPIPLTAFNINIVPHVYLSFSFYLSCFPNMLTSPFVLAFNFSLWQIFVVMPRGSPQNFWFTHARKPTEVRTGINSTDLCNSLVSLLLAS